jgi:hypothetical protein
MLLIFQVGKECTADDTYKDAKNTDPYNHRRHTDDAPGKSHRGQIPVANSSQSHETPPNRIGRFFKFVGLCGVFQFVLLEPN